MSSALLRRSRFAVSVPSGILTLPGRSLIAVSRGSRTSRSTRPSPRSRLSLSSSTEIDGIAPNIVSNRIPSPESVRRHAPVDDLRPAIDPSGEVADLSEAGLPEELHGLGAPRAGAAMHDDLVGRREAVQILRQGPERDPDRLGEGGDRNLVRLPHVHEDI